MVKYSFVAADYYDNNSVRAWEFVLQDGTETTHLGYREYVGSRDNNENLMRQINEAVDKAVEKFKDRQDLELKYTPDEDLDKKLKKYIELKNKYYSDSFDSILTKHSIRGIFNFSHNETDFRANGYALGCITPPISFWEKLKKYTKEPSQESITNKKKEFKDLTPDQRAQLSAFWKMLNNFSSTDREKIQDGLETAEKIWKNEELNTFLKKLKEQIPNLDDDKINLFSNLFNEYQNCQEIIYNEYKKDWNKDSNTASNKETITNQELKQQQIFAEFATEFTATLYPELAHEPLKDVLKTKIISEHFWEKETTKFNRAANNLDKEIISFDELKSIVIKDATKDRLRFEHFKKTGKIDQFLTPDEQKKVEQMDAETACKIYGSEMMSKYKNAVIIMEAIRKDKEKGKDISSILKTLNKAMAKDNQFEKHFQPEGIKQYMFDTLMEMGGKEVSKFTPNRDDWIAVMSHLTANTPKGKKWLKEFTTRVKTDKVDTSKQKKIIKSRLQKRAKELETGEGISGIKVLDTALAEIKQHQEEGYEIKDMNKVIQSETKKAQKTAKKQAKQLAPEMKAQLEKIKQAKR